MRNDLLVSSERLLPAVEVVGHYLLHLIVVVNIVDVHFEGMLPGRPELGIFANISSEQVNVTIAVEIMW